MLKSPTYRIGSWQLPARTLEVGAIVAVAFLIRIAYALIAGRIDPVLRVGPLYGDASGYHLLAVNLLNSAGLSFDGQTLSSFRMPGYPSFVALIYGLSQPEPIYVRIVQAFLGAATCLPVMAIAGRLAGSMARLLAGLGLAFHPILVYMTGWVYSETIFLLFAWTGVWLLVVAVTEERFRLAAGAGLVIGFATLFRPEVFAYPAVAAVGALILLRWPRRKLSALVIAQGAALLVLLPWMARNIAVHGSFVPLTTNTGAVLYGGNNENADGGYFLDVPFVLPGYSEADSNQELTRRAFTWITENPIDYLQLLPLKVYKFFAPVEMEHSGSPLGRATLPVNLLYLVFLLIAFWGGTVGWRKNPTAAAILSLLIAWYIAITMILYGGTRVALPIAPALIIFASLSVAELLTRRVASSNMKTKEVVGEKP